MSADYDVVVIGSGVAGLSITLGLAGVRRVLLVTSAALGSGSTPWAQGGIAAAVGQDDDPGQHGDDTIVAGAGMCDDAAVRRLAEDAAERLGALLQTGASFDRDSDGRLALTREGGHHRRRVAHAGGDATGAEVSRALAAQVLRSSQGSHSTVEISEHATVLDLCGVPGHVTGLLVQAGDGSISAVSARAVVLATGGVGGVFAASTNPGEVSGDGLALALRAGATLVDLEFVQFHPTALRTPSGRGQIPLITEALRGEGAVLIDSTGAAIMAGHHPLADLAPRDIVARRIDEVMQTSINGRTNYVSLDATHLGTAGLRAGFPTVYKACRRYGIDPGTEPIPVAPVQHFLCGGVRVDDRGRTDVTGLYAVGEVAATGLHGANRLASNSMIEAMVFGQRLATGLVFDLPARASGGVIGQPPRVGQDAVATIRSVMSGYAGVRRSVDGLASAQAQLDALVHDPAGNSSRDAANRWTVAAAIVAAATLRDESRGCHWREDRPATHERWRQVHVEVRLDASGRPVATSALALAHSQ